MERPSTWTLDAPGLARLASLMWLGSGALVVVTTRVLPLGHRADVGLATVVGMASLVVGTAVWFAPWGRWSPKATLALVPPAYALIAAFNVAADNPWLYDTFFLVSIVWVGLA